VPQPLAEQSAQPEQFVIPLFGRLPSLPQLFRIELCQQPEDAVVPSESAFLPLLLQLLIQAKHYWSRPLDLLGPRGFAKSSRGNDTLPRVQQR
jgi:hypothetical protein